MPQSKVERQVIPQETPESRASTAGTGRIFFRNTVKSRVLFPRTAVMVSAGKIGYQVECKPDDLIALVRAKTADVVV